MTILTSHGREKYGKNSKEDIARAHGGCMVSIDEDGG